MNRYYLDIREHVIFVRDRTILGSDNPENKVALLKSIIKTFFGPFSSYGGEIKPITDEIGIQAMEFCKNLNESELNL